MKIIASKASIALGAFPLSCFVSSFNTLDAEHVKAFRKNSVFVVNVAAWAAEFGLKFRDALTC